MVGLGWSRYRHRTEQTSWEKSIKIQRDVPHQAALHQGENNWHIEAFYCIDKCIDRRTNEQTDGLTDRDVDHDRQTCMHTDG